MLSQPPYDVAASLQVHILVATPHLVSKTAIIDVQRLSQVGDRMRLQVDLRIRHIIDRVQPHAGRPKALS